LARAESCVFETPSDGAVPPDFTRRSKMADNSISGASRFLSTPTDLGTDATRDISGGLGGLLADVFALYLKTKNFHWHMSGPNFRDYHLLLDEQADQVFAMTDPIAERARKIGGTTIRSISDIAGRQRLLDNNADYVDPLDMLAELQGDNKQLVAEMRRVHELCDAYSDVATASLLEVWIDETERRSWFLYESCRTPATR
jgi:starvation-inducible DNA-binding protein